MPSNSPSSGTIASNPSSTPSNESCPNESEGYHLAMPQKRKCGHWSHKVKNAVLKTYREDGNWQDLGKSFKIEPKNVCRWASKPFEEH